MFRSRIYFRETRQEDLGAYYMASVSRIISKPCIFFSAPLLYLWIDGTWISDPHGQLAGSYCVKLGTADPEVSFVSISLPFMWIEVSIFSWMTSELIFANEYGNQGTCDFGGTTVFQTIQTGAVEKRIRWRGCSAQQPYQSRWCWKKVSLVRR